MKPSPMLQPLAAAFFQSLRIDHGCSGSRKPACQCQSMLASLPTRNPLASLAYPRCSSAWTARPVGRSRCPGVRPTGLRISRSRAAARLRISGEGQAAE